MADKNEVLANFQVRVSTISDVSNETGAKRVSSVL